MHKKKPRPTHIVIFVILLAFIAAIVILYNNQYINVAAPTLTAAKDKVIFPAGGETLIRGESYDLRWNGGPATTQIFLVNTEYEKQGVSVSLIDRIYDLKNTGSYRYKVPANIPEGIYKFDIGPLSSKTFMISAQK